jgi:hypothetical protein
MGYAQRSLSGNCGPGNTWGCYPTSTSPDAGHCASLGLDTPGVPHVAYYDAGKLAYATCVGSGGNCGRLNAWRCAEIDDMGAASHKRDVSLAVGSDGFPTIAYHKYIVGGQFPAVTLSVARPATSTGLESGNCGPQGLWQCDRPASWWLRAH